MFAVIVYFIIPVLVVLIVAYFYVETQKRKIVEENKKAIILRVATMKDNFKADLKQLVEQDILTISEREKTYRIANNFFVFQPVTPKSIDYCQFLLNSVFSAMLTSAPYSATADPEQRKVSLFVRALPLAAGGYNASFYRNALPELLKQLVESEDDIYENESEKAAEEPQQVVATATD